ncbi:pectate lyase-like adhesive domain-containing protein [Candidatus Enterococcus clewellii]|uniref:WxL domain-containing protein n=1 Tax=Candidatus Enterococcus clewellii TaxID=1834193 RepID=A0A242K7U0_9ENTE|nr:pectate lyase-like adhesive domain-containing protein [Enterococcus sp. 9E7_DIV0242]OTP15995.1 hypothetical protein A5888_002209 [Enterococcus sp. 9E7_DIV0242]
MRIEKKNYVLGTIAVLFSILCMYFAMNTNLLKANEAVGSYGLTGENITEEAAFSGTIQVDSTKEETLKLEVSGENDGILYAENLQEALPAEYQEKVEFKDIDAGKSVAMTVKKTDGALEIPVTIETELFAEASTRTLSLKKSDEVLETLALETTKDPEADVPVQRSVMNLSTSITPFALAGATEVTTWDEFVSALQNPSVTGIQLMNNIAKGSSSATPGTITRSVAIDGSSSDGLTQYELDMGSLATTNFRITLGAAAAGSEIRFQNLNLKGSGTAFTLDSAIVYSTAANSANWTASFNNVSLSEGHTKRIAYLPNGSIVMDGGEFNFSHSAVGSGSAGGTSITAGWHKLFEAKNIHITNGSKVSGEFSDMFLASSVADSTIRVDQGSVLDLKNSRVAMIAIDGARATVQFDGEGTRATLYGSQSGTDRMGGLLCVEGANSLIEVTNYAEFDLHSATHPCTILMGNYSVFNIKNNADFNVKIDNDASGNAYGAVMRFRTSNYMEFNIDENSVFSLIKEQSSRSETLRLSGSDNTVNVTGGSKFFVHNKGNQEGINYDGGSRNSFYLKDKNSKVEVISEQGRGINAGTYFKVAGESGTEFTVDGYGSSNAAFSYGNNSQLEFHNMLYYDFRNNSGHSVFDGTATLNSVYSDVSIWKQGNANQLEGNPYRAWTLVDMGLYGAGERYTVHSSRASAYRTFTMPLLGLTGTYTTDDAVHSVLGTTADDMRSMARISGNNADPVVDELRIPTNADKYAFGHVTIPEGVEGQRDAWTDEVTVVLKVTKADGTTYEINGKTVGDDEIGDGLSIYGEPDRAGMFQAENRGGAFFEEGDTVEVLRAWRGGNDGDLNPDPTTVHIGYPGDDVPGDLAPWVDAPVTAIDVTPPTQAVVDSSITLTNATKQLNGTSDENGSKVFVKVNGTWLRDAASNLLTTTVTDGKWALNLPGYLNTSDKLDIYLKDTTVLNGDPGFTLPVTYTTEPDGVYGNINEEVDGYDSYAGYHDAVDSTSTGGSDERFDSAVRLIAKDIIPDAPKLTKYSVSSGGTTTSIGDEVTYTLTAKNDKADSVDWTDVVLEDILATGLDFDATDHGITIKQIDASGTETNVPLAADTFDYNETTRLLSIKLGDIPAKYSYVVTFKVTIGNDATVDQDIMNKATAKGYSPQESLDPFVPGPITGPFKVIDVTSDEVGLPGGTLYGILQLTSAPTVIDFKTHTVTMNDTRVEEPELNMPLTVSDSRGNLKSWTLTATLTKEMAHMGDTTKILHDAIKFNNGTTEDALDGDSTLIKTYTHPSAGDYVVSNDWSSGGTGLKLEVPAGSVRKLGQYQAEITWHLGDTP